MIKRTFLIAIAFAFMVIIISCGSTGNKASSDITAAKTIVNPASTNEASGSTIIASTSQQESNNLFKIPVEGLRPYAVMIDNEGTRILPQGGLDMAQVIYEIIVEGGETRLMPLFWGVEPTMIGPVRSSRHYFLDYAMENDAIYVHYGWSPMAQKDISTLKINNINGVGSGGEIFWDLTNDKKNWQDSYTSTQKILEYVKKVKYRTTTDKKLEFQYNQSNVEPISGETAVKVSIKYTAAVTCSYEYDKEKMIYKRFRKEKPQMERVSGKQLEASNILVQFTPNSTIEGDDKGRQLVTTVGSGKGYLITCGKAIKINWSKASRSAQTEYTDETGKPILLNPGQTWIQILPISGKVILE